MAQPADTDYELSPIPYRSQTKRLDGEMTANALADALAGLRFYSDTQTIEIRIDRSARDYLLDAVAARRGKA